jgi:RNase P/RNase MRP subunit p29
MTTTVNRLLTVLTGIAIGSVVVLMTGVAQQKLPETTKESIKGKASISTEQLHGTVEYVEGNGLVVRMTDGSIREFNVPESRKFTIDGRDLTVHDLKRGTKLSATVTTTTTPVNDRTTTVGMGTVWWVAGKTVIITLPNGENRTYTVKDDYKFNVEGNKNATVSDLKKGMKISAERIVEEPRTEIVSNTVVTGQAPRK